jgi:uncharacterized damage-inducible protein DinB
MTSANSEMERIDASWNELSELVAKLGPEGLTRTGPDGWGVKDHLAHVAAWEHSLLALFEGRDRPSAMGVREPLEENPDAINDAIWKLHQDQTPQEALKYFWETHARLTAVLGKLNDADLQKPYSHYQPSDADEKRPVIDWVAGNTYDHYAEHIGWINQLINESSASR